MKTAVFEHEPWMEDYIRNRFPDHEIIFDPNPLTLKNAPTYSDVDIISVFVHSKIDQAVIDALPNLKLIAARSTGYDHVDVAYAKSKNIKVTNVPQYGSVTVAEHTWALILSLTRKIFESYERTERVNFDLMGLRGVDLFGKTLGIIGLGKIGKNVALMSRGFSMKLRIYSPHPDESFLNNFDNAVYVDTVEDIYSHSDIISFHVPLNQHTHFMLNLNNYHHLKEGCFIINTARGGVLETKALIKGLQEGRIQGAGIDVIEAEAILKDEKNIDLDNLPNEQEMSEIVMDHVLISMDNVIITPHNGFNSNESINRLIDGNFSNIDYFIQGNYEELDEVKI